MDNLMDNMQEAAMYITSRIGEEPVSIGMVLGSGLGALPMNSRKLLQSPTKIFPISLLQLFLVTRVAW